MIDVTKSVSTVYILADLERCIDEEMRKESVRAWHAGEALAFLRERVSSALEEEVKPLARAFRDYIVVTAAGEARHAQEKANKYWRGYSCRRMGRSEAYTELRSEYEYSWRSILEACVDVFSARWTGSYGGLSWKRIAEAGLLYGTVPDIVFLDHVVDLSHNSGLFLDKGIIFYLDGKRNYQGILGAKRADSLLSLTKDRGYLYGVYDRVPYHRRWDRLVTEAQTLGIVGPRPYIAPADDPDDGCGKPDHTYQKEAVTWGYERFAPEVVSTGYAGEDDDDEEKYYCDKCDEYDDHEHDHSEDYYCDQCDESSDFEHQQHHCSKCGEYWCEEAGDHECEDQEEYDAVCKEPSNPGYVAGCNCDFCGPWKKDHPNLAAEIDAKAAVLEVEPPKPPKPPDTLPEGVYPSQVKYVQESSFTPAKGCTCAMCKAWHYLNDLKESTTATTIDEGSKKNGNPADDRRAIAKQSKQIIVDILESVSQGQS